MTDSEMTASRASADPTVFGAAREHLLMVVAIVAAFAIGAVVLTRAQPDTYTAEAVIILQDPAATEVLGTASRLSPERLVQNQLEILRSGIVARRAAASVQQDGLDVTADEIRENTVFSSFRDSDQITITFEGQTEEGALETTGAIVDAYREVQLEQRRAEGIRILERLTAAREALLTDFENVLAEIEALRSQRNLDTLLLSSLDRLAATQAQLNAATNADLIAELTDEIAAIRAQIEALRLGVEVEATGVEMAALLRARDQIRGQLDTIAGRAAELEVQAESSTSGIAFEDPPELATGDAGAGTLFTFATGAFLGLLVALGVAYSLAGRRRVYADRFEPGQVTGLQLLGDIPVFPDETRLPVRDDPRSPSTEAVRFAVGNLQLALDRTDSNSIMFVSTGIGEGKSTILANIAVAAARSGAEVLVIDADFGNQQTSALLLGEIPTGPGLTELGIGKVTLSDAVIKADAGLGTTVDVLSRGVLPVMAPEFFAARSLPGIIDRIASVYSLVLIDGPPLLQVAYSNNVARMAKTVVPIISHGSNISQTIELVDRLRFMDVEVLGYIYNKAPLRIEFLESGGSMRDVLGDRGFEAPMNTRKDK